MIPFQVFVSVTFLTIASVFDLKTREVPNHLWFIFIPVSIITTSIHLLTNPDQLVITGISIALTTSIALGIFYLGLYGGADAKALITLAVVHPIASNIRPSFPFLPLTVFNNSLILMTLTIPLALTRNLHWKMTRHQALFQGLERESLWKKVVTLFLCIKVAKSQVKPYHILAEKLNQDEEVQRTLNIFQRVPEEDTKVDGTLPDDVFVIFSLPMLPFLTIAYIISIIKGDLILHLVGLFLG